MKTVLQRAALGAYGALARTGIMRRRWARRGFLRAYWAYKSCVEAGPVDRLMDFVRPGSTVVDVGANVGFFTLKFARWVGEQGCVIAIEPDLENFEALARQMAGAGMEGRVRLHQAAAVAEAGFVHFRRNELHPGDHRITFDAEAMLVRAVTVDELVAQACARSVSLIKIDVQGAEMLVLEGAKRTLDTMRPALFVEVDDRGLQDFGSSANAFLTYVAGAGYEMYELASKGPPRGLSREGLLARLERSYLDVLLLPGR
jgi:FkbM family methyltransferase